jgi:hypothetical protein
MAHFSSNKRGNKGQTPWPPCTPNLTLLVSRSGFLWRQKHKRQNFEARIIFHFQEAAEDIRRNLLMLLDGYSSFWKCILAQGDHFEETLVSGERRIQAFAQKVRNRVCLHVICWNAGRSVMLLQCENKHSKYLHDNCINYIQAVQQQTIKGPHSTSGTHPRVAL